MALCDAKSSFDQIKSEIDLARQTLQEGLRDHLGLYDWNKQQPPYHCPSGAP